MKAIKDIGIVHIENGELASYDSTLNELWGLKSVDEDSDRLIRVAFSLSQDKLHAMKVAYQHSGTIVEGDTQYHTHLIVRGPEGQEEWQIQVTDGDGKVYLYETGRDPYLSPWQSAE